MATGITIPSVTRIGDSIAISSFGIPYSTSLSDVAASVTANAANANKKCDGTAITNSLDRKIRNRLAT